MIEEAGRNK